MSTSTRLRNIRKERGYTQQEVAEALHIGQNTLSNIENGKSKLDVDLLAKFADFYNVDIQELLKSNSLIMNFKEKVENGYINHIETLNTDNKALIEALKEQLQSKDKQINDLLEVIKTGGKVVC